MKKLLKYLFIGLTIASLTGCGDPGSKKWRLDNKGLTADEVKELKDAIAIRDEFTQKNEWASLNGDIWSEILIYFPEEAKRCRELKGFEKFDGSNWANLLAEEPRFEKDCEKNHGWEMMSPNDWIKLLQWQPNYILKAKQLNVFEKFTAKDWYNAISSEDPTLLKECDNSNGWGKLKDSDWINLLVAKKIDDNLAKKHNAYSKFNNVTWAKLISQYPAFLEVAEKEGVFEKFTPNEWNILFISNPEFATVAKKAKALEKYSKVDLIKLYVLQPKLRNEIFALNKINMDFAKRIEVLYNKFENNYKLNAEELVVLSSIFPELLDSLSEQSFSHYNAKDWVEILKKSRPLLFKEISKKYVYLVPWKDFEFVDWCKILDTKPELIGAFKNNIKISNLTTDDIIVAIEEANIIGYSTLDSFKFWEQFTNYQYNGLLDFMRSGNYGMLKTLIGLKGSLKNQDKMWSYFEELFQQNKKHEPKNYDIDFIISKASRK